MASSRQLDGKRANRTSVLIAVSVGTDPAIFPKIYLIRSHARLRARGRFEPIISEETYDRVQSVLAGRGPGATDRGSLNTEFPLRSFVRCLACGTPLTASFSTGKSGRKYPYYTCWEKTCRSVSVPREKLHMDFAIVMESLRPREELWPLLGAILKDVCRAKHEEYEQGAELASKHLQELERHKDRLIRAMVDGRLKQHLFDEQMEKVEAELCRVAAQQLDSVPDETELDDLVGFVKWVLENGGMLWSAAEYGNQIRLQSAFFPSGLSASKEGLGTPDSFSLFRQFDAKIDDPMCGSTHR